MLKFTCYVIQNSRILVTFEIYVAKLTIRETCDFIYGVAMVSALVTTRQLEFHIVFVQLVNASLSYCKLEFL